MEWRKKLRTNIGAVRPTLSGTDTLNEWWWYPAEKNSQLNTSDVDTSNIVETGLEVATEKQDSDTDLTGINTSLQMLGPTRISTG